MPAESLHRCCLCPSHILQNVPTRLPSDSVYSLSGIACKKPALHPEPALEFDLHYVPNPPRAMRQTMTGKHHDVQKELLQDAAFCAELDRAYGVIKAAMTDFERGRSQPPASAAEATDQGPNVAERSGHGSAAGVLLVGCSCAKGKHRSPAFVESLLETEEWPNDWHVKAVHRELDDLDEHQVPISKDRKGCEGNHRTSNQSASANRENGRIWDF